MSRSKARGEVVNKARLCLITGRSRYEIDCWVEEGCPTLKAPTTRGGDWQFATAQVFDWLANRAKPDAEELDLEAERARLAKEQADAQALKNKVARLQLLPAAEVEQGWMAAIGRCRALLLGIPNSSAARIVLLARQYEDGTAAERAVRELLIRLIDTAVNELRDLQFGDEDDDGGDVPPVTEAA